MNVWLSFSVLLYDILHMYEDLHSGQIFLYVLFQSLLPVIFSHLPAGTSWKSFLHYFQEMIAGKYTSGPIKSFQTPGGASTVEDSSLMVCYVLFWVNIFQYFESRRTLNFPLKSPLNNSCIFKPPNWRTALCRLSKNSYSVIRREV